MKAIIIILVLLLSFSFAQESGSIENRQKAVIFALDSIEENVIGFAINGKAKSGILGSILNSDNLPDGEFASEYSAYSDFLLNISARPSKETKATFDLRFHKDWQSAYREGNNSPIIRWWSYDGNILDKKLKFNLGTMRIAYTPLTIYLPEPNLISEPEIFSNLKKEAMEERYLDGTNRRLLQGLNAEYRTSSIGLIDDVLLQGTIMRLHRNDKSDRIAYDFDLNKDRYSTAARLGIKSYGFSFGVADVYTFDRVSSAHRKDSLSYEKNNVLSFELGYNSKKIFSENINFGIKAEYALSNWSHYIDEKTTTIEKKLKVDGIAEGVREENWFPTNSPIMDGNRYPYYEVVQITGFKFVNVEKNNNKGALLADAFVSFNQNPFEVKLSGHFLNVNKDFEAELAASPAYLPNLPILNSNANLESVLSGFRTASLENMYYSLYYTLPMSAFTIVNLESSTINAPMLSGSTELYNNYKFAQYYRNAYTQQTYTRLERQSIGDRLDPSVNLALPFGYATPDRKGGDADLSFVWNKAINVRGVFGKYSSENGGDYTRFGGGAEVNIAKLAGLNNAIVISGSYEQNKEEKAFFNPQTDRIMVGAKVGVWRGLSIIGGFQQLNREYDKPYLGLVDEASEILAIGGPQIKISEKAEFSLQAGLLSNSIKGAGEKLEMKKYILSGTVMVEF